MREGLIQALKLARRNHWKNISDISKRYGYQPFLVNGAFDTVKLTQYFLERRG